MMRHVFALPPKDSWRTRVNLESLYGMCWDLPSVRLFMTRPNVVSDLLIVFASSNVRPVAPVFEIFSEPAKSTR